MYNSFEKIKNFAKSFNNNIKAIDEYYNELTKENNFNKNWSEATLAKETMEYLINKDKTFALNLSYQELNILIDSLRDLISYRNNDDHIHSNDEYGEFGGIISNAEELLEN